jgi:predicted nucleic acid-binding protein
MSSPFVADSSVLFDLDHGGVVEHLFRLAMPVIVSELVFSSEVKGHFGSALHALGLRIVALEGTADALARAYYDLGLDLTRQDASLLGLAKEGGHILLAGDRTLVELAKAEKVEVHGVLWVLDRLETEGFLTCEALHAALSQMLEHPRCRLPRGLVAERLRRYGCGEQR